MALPLELEIDDVPGAF